MSQVARASSPSKGSMPPKGILDMLAGTMPPVRAESDGESAAADAAMVEKVAEAAAADAGDQEEEEEEEDDT